MANVANTSIVISAVDQATETINKVTGGFTSLEKRWVGLVSALGISAGVGYLTNLVKQSLEAADSMGDLAASVGVNVATLSKYKLAADVSGTSLEGLANGLKRLSVNMLDTSNGTGEAQDAFKALNVSVTDSNGKLRDADKVLVELADKFSNMEDGTTKTALAMRVFGKAGAELIPFLNNGSAGLQELADTAEALGLVLDEKTVAAADRTNDMFTILGQVTGGLGNRILREVLPTLEGLASRMLDAAKQSGALEKAAQGVAAVFKLVVSVGLAAFNTLQAVGGVLGGIVAAVVAAVRGDFSEAWNIIKSVASDTKAQVVSTAKDIGAVWSESLGTVDGKTVALTKSFNALATGADKTKKAVEEYAKAVKTVADLTAKSLGVNADYVEKLRQLELWYSRNRDKTEQYVEAVEELIRQQPVYKEQLKAIEEAQKAQSKAAEEAIELDEKQRVEREQAIRKTRELVEGIQFEADALRMTSSERQIAIALRQIEKDGIERGTAAYEHFARAIREAVISKEAVQQNIDANKKIADEWAKTTEQMGQSLADWIMQGGKNAADYLKGLFRSTVLTPILRPLLTGLTGAVGSLLGLAPGAALAGGGGGLGLGLGLSTLGSFAQTGLLNTVLGSGTLAGLSAAGSLIGGGNVLGGIGMGLGSIAPWVAGAAALYSLIKGGGETRYGAQYGISGGQVVKLEGPSGGDPKAAEVMASIKAANDAMRAAITGFGGTSALNISRVGYELSKDAGKRFSEIFVGGEGRRQYGFESNEAVADAFGLDLKRAVLLGLQRSDIDEQFAEYFRAVDAFALDAGQLDAILTTATAARVMAEDTSLLGGVFARLSEISVDARANILELTGGLEAFMQKAGGFVAEFYSASEQAGITAAGIYRSLVGAGVDVGGLDTKEEFRALVEAVDLTSEVGQQQLSALLNNAQAFAGIVEYMQTNNLTLEQLAKDAPGFFGAVGEQLDDFVSQTVIGPTEVQNDLLGTINNSVINIGERIAQSVNAAVSAVGNRPIEVTVNITSPEVNGGYLGGGN